MRAAIIWGLIQGLTEFLPVSSSGHLVVIPALLSRLGMEIEQPDLAVTAVLHLGTLMAVLIYFRHDILKVLRFRTDPEGRKIALLVGIGTLPALVGLPLADTLDSFQDSVVNVGWALIATGLILLVGQKLATGHRTLGEGRIPDAIVVGVAQMFALIPGISRSGITISAGNGRKFFPSEAARFSFLLGIPAIAGGGLSQLLELDGSGTAAGPLLVGTLVAAVSGYAAIALLLAALRRVGLVPFAIYCFMIGTVAIVWL
ncbi:MAG: undecaprenyl-diphosphate phosphatase [Acidimicrobiia bacterium]